SRNSPVSPTAEQSSVDARKSCVAPHRTGRLILMLFSPCGEKPLSVLALRRESQGAAEAFGSRLVGRLPPSVPLCRQSSRPACNVNSAHCTASRPWAALGASSRQGGQ